MLNYPNYVSEPWHGTMLTLAVSAFSVFVNVVFARDLPFIEGLVVIIHCFAWIGIIVALWVVSPMGDAHTVFTTFSDNGGWGNIGGSTLIGITTSILPFMGADAAVHMSEEVKDASRSIPHSMIWCVLASRCSTVFVYYSLGTKPWYYRSTFINGLMAWIMAITICFAVTTMDLAEVLSSPTGYPHGKDAAVKFPSQHMSVQLTWPLQSPLYTMPSVTLRQRPRRCSCGPTLWGCSPT